MILRPKDLPEMMRKLRELPEEKRKVIVLVGRHLNEGTLAIASRHHKDWEKHGAVVLKIPTHWTPENFWHTAYRKRLSEEEILRLSKGIPSDHDIVSSLNSSGFNVPVVNFHSTPKNWQSEPRLEYYSRSPDYLGREHHLASNEFLAEYYFQTNNLVKEDLRKKVFLFADSHGIIGVPGHLTSFYLIDGRLTRDSLDLFSSKLSKNFELYISHVQETYARIRPSASASSSPSLFKRLKAWLGNLWNS